MKIVKEIAFSIMVLVGLAMLVIGMKGVGSTILDAVIEWRYKNNGHG